MARRSATTGDMMADVARLGQKVEWYEATTGYGGYVCGHTHRTAAAAETCGQRLYRSAMRAGVDGSKLTEEDAWVRSCGGAPARRAEYTMPV